MDFAELSSAGPLCKTLLPGEYALVEVEGHLLGIEGGDAEVARDAVEKRGIGRPDEINPAVQILGTESESRYHDDLGFDVATDRTAGDGALPLVRDRFELRLKKHGPAHARIDDHPEFATIENNGHRRA